MSDRTTAALAAYSLAFKGVTATKENRGRWSDAELNRQDRALGVAAKQAKARSAYADVEPMIVEMRAEGMTTRQIANVLTANGLRTRRGCPWNPMQVHRILSRKVS